MDNTTESNQNLENTVEDAVIKDADSEILNKATEKVAKLNEGLLNGAVLNGSGENVNDNLETDSDSEKDEVVVDLEKDVVDDNEDSEDDENETITLTKKELQSIKDSESDKKVAKVLEKKQKEWNAEKEQLLSEKQEEFEKYSKLTDSEKKQKELDEELNSVKDEKLKLEEALKQVESDKLQHEEKVKQFNNERLLESIKNDLILNELPVNLAPILFKLEDADKIKRALEELKEEFGVILKERTAKLSQTKAPQVSNKALKRNKKLTTAEYILKARNKNKK